MAESREILTAKLNHQLGALVSSVEIGIRSNLANANVVAETTLAGLLNRVCGWQLVNANELRQNNPGVDLIDPERNIAIQVTSTRSVEKVRNTLTKAAGLGVTFENLIVLIITNQSATAAMRACTVPGYTGPMEVWNIPDVFRRAKELDMEKLRAVVAYLDAELGSPEEAPHLEMPLYSVLQSSGFVGREPELAEIRSRFARGDKLVVLTGLGGMGKTELAVQYGREHPGRVYFARFDGSFTRTLANMASCIRPSLSEAQLRQDELTLSGMVLQLLEASGAEDLLIIDNADCDAATLADLQLDTRYQALSRLPLRLLLTTRSAAPRAIGVDAMPRESLFEIFRKHGADVSERDMADLIDAVNGHTLTIDLIARTLNSGGLRRVTAEMMRKALRENTLPSEKYRKIATDYNQSTQQAQIYQHLSTVFDLSRMSDDETRLLGTATLFPENGIDGDLIASIVTDEEAEVYEALMDRGWLENKGGLLTIHPIIRLVCRTEIPPTDESCFDFLNGLIDQYDKKNYQKDQYRQMAEVLTNASRFLADTDGNRAGWAAILWQGLGDFVQALDCDLLAIRKMEETIPPDHPELATAYDNAGLTYINLGNHNKALEYQKKALAIREKVLPPDHPNLATSYNNMGYTFGKLGERKKELEYQQKALAIRKKVLPPDHPDLAQSYNNVGLAYGKLGDHEKELEYKQKALAIREKVLPPDHPDLATSYNNVGYAYGELGDRESELEYLLKALSIWEKALPPNHPNLAISYNNVGCTYGELGDREKELEYKQKALAIWEQVLPPDHPDLAMSCNNIACTYYKMGQLQEAVRYMRRAADIIRRSSLPENHPDRVDYTKWAAEIEQEANMQQAIMAQMQEWGMNPFGIRRE